MSQPDERLDALETALLQLTRRADERLSKMKKQHNLLSRRLANIEEQVNDTFSELDSISTKLQALADSLAAPASGSPRKKGTLADQLPSGPGVSRSA